MQFLWLLSVKTLLPLTDTARRKPQPRRIA
jgi:hypothetical protein